MRNLEIAVSTFCDDLLQAEASPDGGRDKSTSCCNMKPSGISFLVRNKRRIWSSRRSRRPDREEMLLNGRRERRYPGGCVGAQQLLSARLIDEMPLC